MGRLDVSFLIPPKRGTAAAGNDVAVPSCRRCRADNPEGARFCMSCGIALEPAGQTQRRRMVTMLFADVAGSTALGERLDPEPLSSMLGFYFGAARAIIEDHGGAVEKFIGDAIVGSFGLGVAHEDDAIRAVRAAFEIQQAITAMNPGLQQQFDATIAARIGVHTGEVAVDGAESSESLIFGDAANTAARLEQRAEPGEVLIGQRTYRLIQDHVEVEPVAPMMMRGKAEAVDAVRLVSVHPPGRATDRARPPIFGRELELATLTDHFKTAIEGRGAHSVSIIGEAGVGKSTLVQSFLELVSDGAMALTGRCLPYGAGITYWPIAEIFRQAAGIQLEDPPDTARVKLRALAGQDEETVRAVEWIGQAIGLVDASASAEGIAWAAVTLLRHLAARGPIVVVFEELHWAEPTLLSLVELISTTLGDSPVVVVCSARPELLENRPEWGDDTRGLILRLSPLSRPAAAQLLATLLDERLERSLEEQLMEASQGNPLFLTQIASMLLEEGLVERVGGRLVAAVDVAATVPASIQALLAARIDALPDDEATLLTRASVLGSEFDLCDAIHLTPDRLHSDLPLLAESLRRRGFLLPLDIGATVFRYANLLIRDVAYEQLTKTTRAELHAATADRFRTISRERAAEFDEIIGYHFEQAFRYQTDIRPITGIDRALADQAAEHLVRAGRRALLRDDATAAARLLKRGEALLSDDNADRARVLTELGEALFAGGRLREADQRFAEVQANETADQLTRTLARLRRSELRMQMESPRTKATLAIEREAREAMDLFTAHGDDQAVVRAGWLLFMTSMKLGQAAVAQSAVDQLRESARRLGVPNTGRLPGAQAMIMAWGPTPVPEALSHTAELLLAVRGDPSAEPLVLAVHAFLLALDNRLAEARQALVRQREALESSGQRVLMWASWGQSTGRVELAAGDPLRAEAALRESYEALRDIGERGFASTLAGQLAHVLIAGGRYAEAAPFVAECRRAARGADAYSEVLWRTAQARRLVASGDLSSARQMAAKGSALALRTEWPNVQGDALLDQCHVLTAVGDRGAAAEVARHALAIYQGKANRPGVERASKLLGELSGTPVLTS